MFGAIEIGGTKVVCGIGTGPEDLEVVRIATTTPQATLKHSIEFFRNSQRSVRAVGIGSFGPLDLHPESATFGYITTTLSSQRIILGGGVMQRPHLFPLIRREFSSPLNGYIKAKPLTESLDEFVVPPKLGNLSGVLGALVLAEEALNRPRSGFPGSGAAAPRQ